MVWSRWRRQGGGGAAAVVAGDVVIEWSRSSVGSDSRGQVVCVEQRGGGGRYFCSSV